MKLQDEAIPSPRTIDEGVPAELEAICMKAVAKKPEDRYATAAEFQAAIEGYLDHVGSRAGQKSVAKLMNELFAEKRAQTKAEIDARIREPVAQAQTFEIPVIGEAGTPPVTGTSGAHSRTPSLERESTAVTRNNRAVRRMIGAAVGVAVVAGGVGIALVVTKGKGGAAVATPGPSGSASAAVAAEPRECEKNAECVKAHEGKPWICRKDDGKCVSLESEDCKVLAEPGDVENDRTIWSGVMVPTTGPKSELGTLFRNAADLARRDFALVSHGIESQAPDTPPRPLGLVACDDAEQTTRPAHHLVDDVGVPAVVGFASSQEVVDLATDVFIPKRVLTIAALNPSAFVTSVRQPPGEPRLVWRTTLSIAEYQAPVALVVQELLEPRLRAAHSIAADAPIRVALVRPKTSLGLSIADALLPNLRFNGMDVVQNEHNFREFVIGDRQDYSKSVSALLTWKPHIVIYASIEPEIVDDFITPLETRWPATEAFRPYFLVGTPLVDNPALLRMLGKNVERRRRYFGISPPANSMLNMKFTLRYNETFTPKVTLSKSPSNTYDAVYLLAYAAYANGERPLTGINLARAIPRLLPPGRDIEVGVGQIHDAFSVLGSGKNIDLRGAQTPLDFNPETGESSSDMVIQCVGVNELGVAADGIASGVVYDARARSLKGTMRCP